MQKYHKKINHFLLILSVIKITVNS